VLTAGGTVPVEARKGMHMKIETQSTPELTHLGALIENMRVAMLTNIDSDGELISRPMSPIEMDADGVLWFFIDATTINETHVRSVNLSFSDADAGTYVSLSARGEIDLDRACMQRMWTPLAKAWFPDGPSSPDLALLKIVPHTAEYWDAPHSRMIRMFAMAAAAVTGESVPLGDHGTFTELSKDASKRAWDDSTKLWSMVDAERR
jgi:general stress protein 26